MDERRAHLTPSAARRLLTPPPPASTAPFVLVHLSDLHFGIKEPAGLWYGQLAEDLRRELGINRIDALCLSAYSSVL